MWHTFVIGFMVVAGTVAVAVAAMAVFAVTYAVAVARRPWDMAQTRADVARAIARGND